MPDWVVFLLFPLGYFVVMRWLLPRMGVQT